MTQVTVFPDDAEPAIVASPSMFIGHTIIRRVSDALGTDSIIVNALYFEAGARSRPHRHDADQILLFIKGPGIVAVDGGEDQLIQEGQFVVLPANKPHMHGAPEGNPAVHISMMAAAHTNDFDCPIAESWTRFRQ